MQAAALKCSVAVGARAPKVAGNTLFAVILSS